jgi:hypothetical protein
MSVELFDPQLVIARLAERVSGLRKVAGAVDFATAAQDLKQPPAAYVIELANRASRNSLAVMAVSQENEIRFGVIMAVQNLRDARGDAAQTDMNVLVRKPVMAALLGWAPHPDSTVIEYSGGRLLQLDNLVLWWQDDYLTSILERSS